MLIERSTFLSRLLDRLFSEATALAVELERKPREDADWDRTNQLLARIEEVSAAMRPNASHDCAIAATSGVTPKEPPPQTCAAGSVPEGWPDPTPEMLDDPRFDAIWQAMKTWDIHVPGAYDGYCGTTGNHVRAILDALSASPSPPVQTVGDVGGGTLHADVTEPAGVEKVIDPTVGRQ